MKDKLRILVIGLGNHACRIYLPSLSRLSQKRSLSIYGVDVKAARERVERVLKTKGLSIKPEFIKGAVFDGQLSSEDEEVLNKIVSQKEIDGVIIATPPEYHRVYALWAIKNGLHILMDKPITTRKDCSTDESQAKKLIADYDEIAEAYQKLNSKKKTIFMINTQRRYEVGYRYIFKLLREVADRFSAPVTSIQAMHSDGVWIFPDEIVEQQCHNYFNGHGKCSHSGFHLFDIVWQFYKAGQVQRKVADSAEVFTSFVKPRGLLKQFGQDDYRQLFGSEYDHRSRRSTEELNELFKTYGENDAFSQIRLLKDGDNVCNISINLLHNSFSERSWVDPAKDLYKGNGRIKHQSYYIQQGPFQAIQVHNYQSKSKQDTNNISDYELGGNNHFDIYIFRNAKFFGKDEKNLRVLSLKDLANQTRLEDSRLYHETAKDLVVEDYLKAIAGEINQEEPKTNFLSYRVPVQIMSAIYASNARYEKQKNPLVKFKLKNEKAK